MELRYEMTEDCCNQLLSISILILQFIEMLPQKKKYML